MQNITIKNAVQAKFFALQKTSPNFINNVSFKISPNLTSDYKS